MDNKQKQKIHISFAATDVADLSATQVGQFYRTSVV